MTAVRIVSGQWSVVSGQFETKLCFDDTSEFCDPSQDDLKAHARCGLLSALFVYWTAARCISPTVRKGSAETQGHSSEFAKLSALIFLSSIGVITFARGASFDMVVTMTLTGALASFFRWQVTSARISASLPAAQMNNPPKLWLLPGFYCFIGLSLLAKGLIGIVIPFNRKST